MTLPCQLDQDLSKINMYFKSIRHLEIPRFIKVQDTECFDLVREKNIAITWPILAIQKWPQQYPLDFPFYCALDLGLANP